MTLATSVCVFMCVSGSEVGRERERNVVRKIDRREGVNEHHNAYA